MVYKYPDDKMKENLKAIGKKYSFMRQWRVADIIPKYFF